MIIAGCKCHYVQRSDVCDFSDHIGTVGEPIPCRIWNADASGLSPLMPEEGGLYAVTGIDNSQGDHDKYHMIARYSDGQFYSGSTGAPLIEYVGDEIVSYVRI